MKKRPLESDGGRDGGDGSAKPNSSRRKRQRLGGKGLSLEAFANAKSKRTDYNPSLIKKQREFYKNAKYVSKYKKSLKQSSNSQEHHSAATPLPKVGGDGDESGCHKKIKNKKKKSLQSLQEEYVKRQEEEAKARMEREENLKVKKEEKEKAQVRRKTLREKMFKKTRFGQPVMKYRIEHLLESIQSSGTSQR